MAEINSSTQQSTFSTIGGPTVEQEAHAAAHAAMGNTPSYTYTSGLLTSFTEDGITYTLTYTDSANPTKPTVITTSTGRTITKTYNLDGTIASNVVS